LLKRCSGLTFLEPPQPGGVAPDGSLQQYFVGVDLGRTNDKTAIVWMTEYPKGQFQAVRAMKIEDTPLPMQEKMIEEILNLPQVNRLAIDRGGLGMQMAESLGAKFPEKLIPFDFTMQSKNNLVQNALSKMERDLVRITPGCATEIIYDLSLIQRTFTSFGNMIYGAKRTASGHADGAWAFLLAMEAMREGGSGYMMMDFGLDQKIIDMINQEGSLRIRDIGSYNAAVSRLAETERDVEQRERQIMMQYCSRLTGNGNVGIFTDEEIGQMTDNERDFYGMAPRGNHGDV
jgi:phage FluMu gp28-like protein